MASTPSINTPRDITLRSLQELANSVRQRLDRVDAALLNATRSGSGTPADFNSMRQDVATLRSQLLVISQRLGTLEQASGAVTGTETRYVLIEVEGLDGEDGIMRL